MRVYVAEVGYTTLAGNQSAWSGLEWLERSSAETEAADRAAAYERHPQFLSVDYVHIIEMDSTILA